MSRWSQSEYRPKVGSWLDPDQIKRNRIGPTDFSSLSTSLAPRTNQGPAYSSFVYLWSRMCDFSLWDAKVHWFRVTIGTIRSLQRHMYDEYIRRIWEKSHLTKNPLSPQRYVDVKYYVLKLRRMCDPTSYMTPKSWSSFEKPISRFLLFKALSVSKNVYQPPHLHRKLCLIHQNNNCLKKEHYYDFCKDNTAPRKNAALPRSKSMCLQQLPPEKQPTAGNTSDPVDARIPDLLSSVLSFTYSSYFFTSKWVKTFPLS